MATITQKLAQLESDRQDLVDNLETKGITGLSGDETFTELVPQVLDIPSGEDGVGMKDVNFYDYDGTLLYSYTKEAFAELTEMPANPTHTGLTAQGWNWTLSDAKTYVAEMDILDIGQHYITDDGATRFYLSVETEEQKSVTIHFTQSKSEGVEIDWGDGSETVRVSGTQTDKTVSHTYLGTGNYVVSFMPDDDCYITPGYSQGYFNNYRWNLFGSTYYQKNKKWLTKIELGKNISALSGSAYYSIYTLQTITTPSYLNMDIPDYIFGYCYYLKYIVVPNGATSIGNFAFTSTSLNSACLPKTINSLGQSAFTNCMITQISINPNITIIPTSCFGYNPLRRVVFNDNITELGSSSFNNTNLTDVVLPSSITTLRQNSFASNRYLKSIDLGSVETIEYNAFSQTQPLNVIMSDSLVTYGSSSGNVGALINYLNSVEFPSTLRTVGNYGLTPFGGVSLKFSGALESIGNSAFNGDTSLKLLDFSECTRIPTLGTTPFVNIQYVTVRIRVPDNLYEEWVLANIWTNYKALIDPYRNGEPMTKVTLTLAVDSSIQSSTSLDISQILTVATHVITLPTASNITTTETGGRFYFTDGTTDYELGDSYTVSTAQTLTLMYEPPYTPSSSEAEIINEILGEDPSDPITPDLSEGQIDAQLDEIIGGE